LKILNDSKGQVAILISFLLPIFIAITGLVIDVAILYTKQAELQNGVDFTALSAVQETKVNHGQVVETGIHVARQNEIVTKELTITHPYQGNFNQVEIIATKVYKPYFMSIFGIKDKPISARAVAERRYEKIVSYTDLVLDYAVFHGNTGTDLQIKGNGSLIEGNVHSNKKIAIQGANHNITGTIEAIDGISGDLSSITGTIISKGAPIIPIPDFNFQELASKANKVYDTNMIFNDVEIDGIWLINGDVTLNGGRIRGKGIILATGSISMPSNSVEYSSSNDLLALYALGDISLSCTKNNIQGILYAPNGTIKISGSNNTFYGALIAKDVYWVTKDITISGNYDVRVPSAFTIEKEEISLVE